MSREQAEAVLFGVALGDALGYPVEFMDLDGIKARYGADGIQAPPTPALYSDDTQMTVALAEGLLAAGLDADLDAQMQAVGSQFVDWMHNAPSRAPGNTCLSGVANFEQGMPWRESGVADSKGCGSAMRVAPVGYLYQHDPERLVEVARASGLITHGHPAAVAASIAAAYLVKLALDGEHPDTYLRQVLEVTDGMSEDFDAAMYRVGQAHFASEEQCLRHIGEGWTGEEAVGLALWCVVKYPDDYAAAVRRAANITGDSDSVASIAGGISAARLGLDAIPGAWRNRCENHHQLVRMAERMAAPRG